MNHPTPVRERQEGLTPGIGYVYYLPSSPEKIRRGQRMTMGLWLAMLLGGNLLLVAGLFLTRLNWRPDVEPFGRGSPILQILIHPERFATPSRLRMIRMLNLLGSVLLFGAVAVLAYELFFVVRG